MESLTLDISEIGGLDNEQLYQLCRTNREIHIERTSKGELILMAPTGGETGRRNSELNGQILIWSKQNRAGLTFDSSTGFLLPNGAMRAADVAWIQQERWDALTAKQRRRFPPLCPDFVIELMSESDRLQPLHEKMQEWMENGCQLAWLIDPESEIVYIYRADGTNDTVSSFDGKLSGEDVLPGFELELGELR